MILWQEYKRPTSVVEAIHDLTSASGSVMPIAGGTDLLLDLKQGRYAPVHTLIDLTFIPEMTALELRGDKLYVGASVAVNRIALDPLVGTHAQALVEACNLIAGPQVRHAATLGGNVAHALPAADGTIALTALDAQAEIAGVSGTRRMALTSLFLGPGQSALNKSTELIVGFYIPTYQTLRAPNKTSLSAASSPPRTAAGAVLLGALKVSADQPGIGMVGAENCKVSSCFKRIMRPQGVALPILNCAIWLAREKDVVKDIRIAIGPGGATPLRATQAENVLQGQPLNEETIRRALESLHNQAKFRTSARRASADYRKHIVIGLFKDVLDSAWQRAK